MSTESALLAQFTALDTATVSDALDGCGLAPGQGGLRPMWGRPKVAGFAVTVELEPLSGEHAGAHILTEVIAEAGPDDVIVIANGGRTDVSSWGGIVSVGAAMRSVRGVITDGACRDVGQAREIGFPVFARAQVPVTARGRLRQRSTGEPIQLGDVTVRPGDVMMADEGGVVVVPRERAAEVLDAAERLAGREAAIEAEVRAGVPLPQAMRDARLAGTEGSVLPVLRGYDHGQAPEPFQEKIGIRRGHRDRSPYLTEHDSFADVDCEVAYPVIASAEHHRHPDRAIEAAGDVGDELALHGKCWLVLFGQCVDSHCGSPRAVPELSGPGPGGHRRLARRRPGSAGAPGNDLPPRAGIRGAHRRELYPIRVCFINDQGLLYELGPSRPSVPVLRSASELGTPRCWDLPSR